MRRGTRRSLSLHRGRSRGRDTETFIPEDSDTIKLYRACMFNMRRVIAAAPNKAVEKEMRSIMGEAAEKFAFAHTRESKEEMIKEVVAATEILLDFHRRQYHD